MSQPSVLYDAMGPKARRRAGIGTAVAIVLLLALAYVVVARLADREQFTMEKWGPLIDPNNENFDSVWRVLWGGMLNTLQAAVFAMVLAVVLGTVIAVGRLSLGRAGRLPLVGLVELLRGLPVIVLVYFAVKVFPTIGIDFAPFYGGRPLWGLVIALTAYNMVIFAEVVRAGVVSLPKGQREAALATGLTNGQAMRLVLLPQAFRVMLPAIISQLVVVLKDTSLVAFVGGFPELLDRGKSVQRILDNPIQALFVVALMYIIINFALSKLAQAIQKRQSRAGRSSAEAIQEQTTATGA